MRGVISDTSVVMPNVSIQAWRRISPTHIGRCEINDQRAIKWEVTCFDNGGYVASTIHDAIGDALNTSIVFEKIFKAGWKDAFADLRSLIASKE